MKRYSKRADEKDVVSRYWRHRVYWRTGEVAAIKRRMRRRERHEARHELDKRKGHDD